MHVHIVDIGPNYTERVSRLRRIVIKVTSTLQQFLKLLQLTAFLVSTRTGTSLQ